MGLFYIILLKLSFTHYHLLNSRTLKFGILFSTVVTDLYPSYEDKVEDLV